MNLSTISTLIVVSLILVLADSASSPVSVGSVGSRSVFKLPEILNLDSYQKAFNKHYGSMLERLARMKILTARAFRVFVSATNYLRGLTRSYKKINQFSDRTEEELAQMSNKVEQYELHSLSSDHHERVVRKKRDIGQSMDRIHSMKLRGLNSQSKRNGQASTGSEDDSSQATSESTITDEETVAQSNKDETLVDEGSVISEPTEEIYVDHRKCLSEPRSQEYIGTCYSFSSISLAEWIYCRDTGEKLLFSEQFIVDCGNGYLSLDGANGGFERDVGSFIGKFGLQLLDHYPYNGAVNKCPYNLTTEAEKVGYLKVSNWDYRKVDFDDFETMIEKTPLVATVAVGEQFYEYGGGLFDNQGWDAVDAEVHSMLFVGHGRQDGVDYWLVRNSFGSSWGEGGYIRLMKSCPCIYLNKGYTSGGHFRTRAARFRNPLYEPRNVTIETPAKGQKKSRKKSY